MTYLPSLGVNKKTSLIWGYLNYKINEILVFEQSPKILPSKCKYVIQQHYELEPKIKEMRIQVVNVYIMLLGRFVAAYSSVVETSRKQTNMKR